MIAVTGCAYDAVIYDSYTSDDLNYRWSSYQYSGYSGYRGYTHMYYGDYSYYPNYYYYQPSYRPIGVGYFGRGW